MADEPIKNGRLTDRNEKGRFIEGNKTGKGKPPGSKNYITLLEDALKDQAQKEGITYWQKLAQWCFTNPKLAAAVLKKFIPDKTHMEIEGDLNQRIDLSGLTIEELKALAYGYTIKNKSSTDKGDTKTGKDRAGS